MDRRQYLKGCTRTVAGMSLLPLFSRLRGCSAFAEATGSYRALVCVQLLGGNDGNDTVIPTDSYYNEYATGRGHLAIARSDLNALKATSSRSFGLHPSLANVASLYNAGSATILANAGPLTRVTTKSDFQQLKSLPAELFSHSSQANEWAAGSSMNGSATGWLGRVADVMSPQYNGSVPMVTSTAGWTLAGQGVSTLQATTGNANTNPNFSAALQALTLTMEHSSANDAASLLETQVSTQSSGFLAVSGLLAQAAAAGSSLKAAFPSSPLGRQLQTIAQMINGRGASGATRQMFVCQAGGFDTHANQLPIQAANLADLDACLGAFANAMKEIDMFNQVTLFTVSDFARSLVTNSSAGTDHAWGNHHLILGGSLNGGKIYGTFPSLVLGGDNDAGKTGQWIPTTSGTQYAATMATWLGLNPSLCMSIFPELANFGTPTIPMFKS